LRRPTRARSLHPIDWLILIGYLVVSGPCCRENCLGCCPRPRRGDDGSGPWPRFRFVQFFRSTLLPAAIVLLFALALFAVSARIWLPGDMAAPAPLG
jgi:hypothetical protein